MNNNSGKINYEIYAISALLKEIGIEMPEIPETTGLINILNVVSTSTGIMYREVTLPNKWYKDAAGPMIATLKDSGKPVALIPSTFGGYHYRDPESGKKIRINSRTEANLSDKAFCFYRPLPQRPMNTKDLLRYMFKCLNVWDFISFALASAAITIVGLLTPTLNQILIGPVIASKSMYLFFGAVIFLFFSTLSMILLTITRTLLLTRIRNKLSINTGAATMMRLLSLPAPFFRTHSAGVLNQDITNINTLCNTMKKHKSAERTILFHHEESVPLQRIKVSIVALINTPKNEPTTVPTPPVSKVPPITAEEIASISKPRACSTNPLVVLRQNTKPANEARKPLRT